MQLVIHVIMAVNGLLASTRARHSVSPLDSSSLTNTAFTTNPQSLCSLSNSLGKRAEHGFPRDPSILIEHTTPCFLHPSYHLPYLSHCHHCHSPLERPASTTNFSSSLRHSNSGMTLPLSLSPPASLMSFDRAATICHSSAQNRCDSVREVRVKQRRSNQSIPDLPSRRVAGKE